MVDMCEEYSVAYWGSSGVVPYSKPRSSLDPNVDFDYQKSFQVEYEKEIVESRVAQDL